MATVRNLACIAFRPEALDVHGLSSVLLGKLLQTLEDTSLISTFSVVINIGLLGKKRLICYCVPTLYLKQKTYTAKMQGHVNKNIAFHSTNPNMKYNGDHHISIIFCQITVHELYHLHKKRSKLL